jgi:hypothetical protein
MFRSATWRERVRIVVEDLLETADIVLTTPVAPPESDPAAPAQGPHPHRAPVRRERPRRPGVVAASRAACASPVRPATAAGAERRVRVAG